MSKNNILEAMRELKVFQGFDEDQFQKLAGIARIVEFSPLSTIFKENEAAADVYVIISGQATLATCAPSVGCRKLMEVHDGDLLGWSAMIGRTRLSDTARTLTPMSAIAINGEQLLALCTEEPQLGFKFMQLAAEVLAQRLHATRMQLLDMTGHRLPEFALESD